MIPLPRALSLAFATMLALAPATAQSLTGRLVDPSNVGIAGVTVDPGNGVTPVVTSLTGDFVFPLIPARTYDVEFRPGLALPWAPRLMTVNVSGSVNLGNVVLQPGFILSGTMVNFANVPLPNGNINVYDSNDVKLFTPGDGTDLLGNFAIVVPAGTFRVRFVPPVGLLLVPRERRNVVVSAAINFGTVQLQQGFVVSGTVVDAVSSLPIGNVDLDAEDAFTGERIVLLNDMTNTLGAFSVLMPRGLLHVSFDPPAGNTHVGRQMFDVVVLANVPLGLVRLTNGAILSGTVQGPSGSIPGCNINVFTTDGAKVYTPNDSTASNGQFAVAVPNNAAYVVEVIPPISAGVVLGYSGTVNVAGNTNAGTINLAAGVQMTGTITGPTGPEVNAVVSLHDPVTGAQVARAVSNTNAMGDYVAVVPTGNWDVVISPDGRSRSATTTLPISVVGVTAFNATLAASPMWVDVSSFGIMTVPQGGPLLINCALLNQTAGFLPTILEIAIRYPSGVEQPVFPPIPLDIVPGIPINFVGMLFALPPVPANQTGREIRFVVRFRDPATLQVQDEDTTPFIVQ